MGCRPLFQHRRGCRNGLILPTYALHLNISCQYKHLNFHLKEWTTSCTSMLFLSNNNTVIHDGSKTIIICCLCFQGTVIEKTFFMFTLISSVMHVVEHHTFTILYALSRYGPWKNIFTFVSASLIELQINFHHILFKKKLKIKNPQQLNWNTIHMQLHILKVLSPKLLSYELFMCDIHHFTEQQSK